MSIDKNDKWLDVIHDKLSEYEEMPPEDDWSAIESSLPHRQHAKIVAHWSRYAAVAAVVLLLIGIAVFLPHDAAVERISQEVSSPAQIVTNRSTPLAATSLQKRSSGVIPTSTSSSRSSVFSSSALMPSPSTFKCSSSSATSPSLASLHADDPLPADTTGVVPIDVAKAQLVAEASCPRPDTTRSVTVESQSKKDENAIAELADSPTSLMRSPSPRTSLNNSEAALLASATRHSRHPLAFSFNAGSSALQLHADNNITTLQKLGNAGDDYVDYYAGESTPVDYTHHLPVDLGIEVEKMISRTLGVAIGLRANYSYSTCNMSGDAKRISQRVYYVGIPVRLNYYVYLHRTFSVYWSNGIEVDKCVYAKLGNTKLSTHNWQYSFVTSLGLQYRLGKRFSVYAEPGVGYYTTSGNTIETYRTQNPLSVNLHVGIKLNY